MMLTHHQVLMLLLAWLDSVSGLRRPSVLPSAFLSPSSLHTSTLHSATVRPGQALRASPTTTSAHFSTATTLNKRSLSELGPHHLSGKRVLVRSDLNVPMDGTTIIDDTRLRASLKTLSYLVGYGAKVLLTTHLGRPKGREDKYSVRHLQPRLSELLGREVKVVNDCIGPAVQTAAAAMKLGDVILLENVRFHPEETENDEPFARSLAENADLFVNDAFGAAHRAHASTEGVTKFLKPSVAGLLLEKEIQYLSSVVAEPQRPFAAIVGGSKVSTKIGVIESLLDKVDKLIIGGGMVFTFFKAHGMNVGSSLVEDDKMETALRLERLAKEKGVDLVLPVDVVAANQFSPDAEARVVNVDQIPDGWWGLDNGPETTKIIQKKLEDCKTIIWNGPMGVSEFDKFSAGTFDVARTIAALTDKGATSIVGGGESVAAVEKCHVAEAMSHISTGGGACLELLEGKVLPGLAALDDVVA
eukprot:GHVS01011937.1.p1 GENE.GHVS01011937.1~~GHVS01011937.1.p1  ORF type:complete len:472 (-),score=82.56 GHVS01011937.1:1654-3069(-)